MTSCPFSKVALVLAAAYSCFNPSPASAQVHGVFKSDPAIQGKILQGYGKLPLTFEANQGQTDPRVKFLSRGPGYTLFLTSTDAVIRLRKKEDKSLLAQPGAANQLKCLRPPCLPLSATDRLAKLAKKPTLQQSDAVLYMKLVGSNPAATVRGMG